MSAATVVPAVMSRLPRVPTPPPPPPLVTRISLLFPALQSFAFTASLFFSLSALLDQQMEAIAAAHFTAEPLACSICEEEVLYKTKQQANPNAGPRQVYRANPYITINPSRCSQQYRRVEGYVKPPITAQSRRAQRQAQRVKRNVAETLSPPPPPPLRLPRRSLLSRQGVPITDPVCADCAHTWRRGSVIQENFRFHARRRRCPGCSVEISMGVKTRSFITGPDRQAYIELYRTKLASMDCCMANSGYCKYGTACLYRHPADLPAIPPDVRQRELQPVTLIRPTLQPARPPSPLFGVPQDRPLSPCDQIYADTGVVNLRQFFFTVHERRYRCPGCEITSPSSRKPTRLIEITMGVKTRQNPVTLSCIALKWRRLSEKK